MSEFIEIEHKEDSAEKLAAIAGQPTKHYIFGPEFNLIAQKINELKQLIDNATANPNVDDGDSVVIEAISDLTFPGNKVVSLGSGRAAIYEKFKNVTSSRALNDRDHNTTLKIKANVTLTVPNTGLPEDFMCYIDVFNGFELTWATSSGVVLSGNESSTQSENTMSMIYRDGSTNNYRLRGEI